MENDDGDNYDFFVNQNYGEVYKHFLNKCHSNDDAEDLTNDTFVKYQPHFNNLTTEDRKPYLWSTANSILCDHYRKKKLIKKLDSHLKEIRLHLTTETNATEIAALREMKPRLRKAIRLLPGYYRQLVILRNYAGWSYNKIAEKLDKNPSTLRVDHVKAIEMLRGFLKDK